MIISILSYNFLQRAVIVGSFIGIICGILGVLLVLRHLSLIGDGLAHVSLAAIAFGLLFGIYPLYITIPVVVAASIFILQLNARAKIYADAAIGIVSAVGVALGVILASRGRGFNLDLFSYLFGNILAISPAEMYLTIILTVVLLLTIAFYYRELFAVVFNPELAQVAGIKVERLNLIFVVLTAITVVLSVRVVGVMLVSAFFVLPAATSLQFARGFFDSLMFSALIAVLAIVVGVIVSFIFDLPTGATIIMVNFCFFIVAFLQRRLRW